MKKFKLKNLSFEEIKTLNESEKILYNFYKSPEWKNILLDKDEIPYWLYEETGISLDHNEWDLNKIFEEVKNV